MSNLTSGSKSCLFCGGDCDAAGRCHLCNADNASAADDGATGELLCPRCRIALTSKPFGRATIHPCGTCRGIFAGAIQFSMIVHDYVAGVELPLGMLPVNPPSAHPEKDAERNSATVACVACAKEMERTNFAERSGAIVDVCKQHGIWIDAGELVPMLHFVKDRAATDAPSSVLDGIIAKVKESGPP
ncbi:MAG: hypothetical protein ABI183_18230 [Polyangiaceae bacterium]